MKYLSVLLLVSFIFSACDTVETDNSGIYPFPVSKIDKIEVNDNVITATIFVGTPSPCIYYYKTEISQNESVYTARIFGKDDGQPCLGVMSSFTREETISFYTKGEKTLRFWQDYSTYLDTTITLE